MLTPEKMESVTKGESTLPAAMMELIQFFETKSKLLDEQHLGNGSVWGMTPDSSSSGKTNFISCIRFYGVPILPPVMTPGKREEARQAQQEAVVKISGFGARGTSPIPPSVPQGSEESREPLVKRREKKIARQPLERPSVLRPVVSSAWDLVTADTSSNLATSDQGESAMESMNIATATSMGNTFATVGETNEEFGLHTLDSVCSDIISLEEVLPTYFHGVPLTTVRQQKISQDLNRLSRILNVKDFNSTGESDAGQPTTKMGATPQGQAAENAWAGLVRGVSRSASEQRSSSCGCESHDAIADVVEDAVDTESCLSRFDGMAGTDCSHPDVPSHGDVEALFGGSTNTFDISSADTTGTSDSQKGSRNSPRSLKNTVHFASFVTEYFNMASSQSLENITVVKKKISADTDSDGRRLSEVDLCEMVSSQCVQDSSSLTGVSTTQCKSLTCSQDGLLCKVSLSDLEAPDPSQADPPSLLFHLKPAINNSSDKENDSQQATVVPAGRNTCKASGHSQQWCHQLPPFYSTAATDTHVSITSDATGSHASIKSDATDSHTSFKLDFTNSQASVRSDVTAASIDPTSSTLIESVSTSNEGMQLAVQPELADKDGEGKRQQVRVEEALIKPKKLPVDPPYIADTRSQGKHSAAAASVRQGPKTHARRGSYTLVTPSPALVRAWERTREPSCPSVGCVQPEEARKLPEEEDCVELYASPQLMPVHLQSTGKAEHISRYLSHVQLHHSGTSNASASSHPEVNAHLESSLSVLQSLIQTRASLLSTDGSEAQLPDEILVAHSQQFERRRQNLVTKQKQELEDLFVQQRREQLSLLAEIEEHQQYMKEQQQFLEDNAPEIIKVQKAVSPEPILVEASHESTLLKQGAVPVSVFTAHAVAKFLSHKPGLSTGSPAQRLVLRHPDNFSPRPGNFTTIITPPQALTPHMKAKFGKLTALARGFLTRCLLRSDRVQVLVETIKATREFAFNFQSETSLAKTAWTQQDKTLFERIKNQLQAALLDIHEIFFDMPVAEQMTLIKQARRHKLEKELASVSSREENTRGSGVRISSATLKVLRRRQQAREAEATILGEGRPSTAPPTSSKAQAVSHDTQSGAIRRHQFLLSRAVKPVTLQATPQQQVSPVHLDALLSRSDKRPQTAPEKLSRPKKPGGSLAPTFNSGHCKESAFSRPTGRLQQHQQQQQHQQRPQTEPNKNAKLMKQSKFRR